MELFRTIKWYKRKLEKRLSRQISRKQLNFTCDRRIILSLKTLVQDLEVPVYVLTEHVLQLGLSELMVVVKDQALREQLCRHLVENHLLTPVPIPESEPTSRRVLMLRNAVQIAEIIELRVCSQEKVNEIIDLLINKPAIVDAIADYR